MSSLASLVSVRALRRGDDGPDVLTLQVSLSQAGYRVNADSDFGPRTDMVVRQFQKQHGLKPDGFVGALTAALLDAPHEVLVQTAAPMQVVTSSFETPHDDTASLIAFYGDPRNNLEGWKAANVSSVKCPWTLYYEGQRWAHPVQFHKKAAPGLAAAFEGIWDAAGKDDSSPLLTHVRNFSGSGEFRAVRGSSRLSCHAFWAAIDFDAERLPLGHGVDATEMPAVIVAIFKKCGAFWGGDYTGRKDPMHLQWAHE